MINKYKKIKKSIGKLTYRASALVYALIIMSIVLVILVSMLGYITSQLKFSGNRVEKEKAFQVAEAGIYFYHWYLAHEVSGKTAQEINDFWQAENPLGTDDNPFEDDFNDSEGINVGRYKIEVERPVPSSSMVMVKSTGWTYKMPNVKRTVQVRFRRPSWSEYAVLANDFMRFGEGTEVYGKIHSNKGIRFDGHANNIVFSAVPTYDDPDHSGNNEFGVHTHVSPPQGSGTNNSFQEDEAPPSAIANRPDVFEAGRQFPVSSIDFNGLVSDLGFMKNETQLGHGIYYDNTKCGSGGNADNLGRHIILNGDTMTVSTVMRYNTANYSITKEDCVLNNVPIPEDSLVFVENNIWIEGIIDGKRTTFVAADLSGGPLASIYIGADNLLYTNLDGTDIIGLIAQNDIEVIKNSLEDLTIDAALITLSGRIGRNQYTPFACGSMACQDHKGTITLNGAMATNLRYGFAYTNGTGYTNRILNFDNNLIYFPPPYFPTGTEYSIDLWEEL